MTHITYIIGITRSRLRAPLVLLMLSLACPGFAQTPDEAAEQKELQKQVQIPVASLISVPFQNNTNFVAGPFGRVQNVLNIQPVNPMRLNDDWNLISRIIVPVVYQPDIATPSLGTNGIET